MTDPLGDLLLDSRLWFPGLAEVLAAAARDAGVEAALPPDAGMAGAASPTTAGQIKIGRHRAVIAASSPTLAAEFDDIDFADPTDAHIHSRLQGAVDLLHRVDTLSDAVGTVVDTIYPLRAPLGHDISYSTPEMPFTVFVSIPSINERDATWRVAEAVLHEAMHLQLTLIDLAAPLTRGGDARGYSPWKHEDRPILGLLHGLYVFAVICQALTAVPDLDDERARRYQDKRTSEIQDEVTALPLCPAELSPLGADLWLRCMEAIASPATQTSVRAGTRQRPLSR